MLAGVARALCFLSGLQRTVYHGIQARPVAERIHGSGLDHAFHAALVERVLFPRCRKLEKRLEAAGLLPRRGDGFHRIVAHILDGSEAKADGTIPPPEMPFSPLF